jgi:16S rRNA (adenine1518-N6/adenine1519-N6)-dimethyltransferase
LDTAVLDTIVQAADLHADDQILEVGPGLGVLTEVLLPRVKRVVAVELDRSLAYVMKQQFRGNESLELINHDILTVKAAEIREWFNNQPFKVVANIPYNITSRLLRKLLTMALPPQSLVLLMQKEVAERIIAKPGKMSRLSVSAQFFSYPEIIAPVSRDCFYPVPEVDSAVIRLIVRPEKWPAVDQDHFFRVVRVGFSAKRKQLQNNLVNGFQLPREQVMASLAAAGLKPTARPQELSVEELVKLAEVLRP